MIEIEDRLTPRDGLNTYNIVLARMELPTHGSAQFTFAVTSSMLPVAELNVSVPSSGQSLDRMTVEAHDAVIDILRQLLFRADKARKHHEKHAGRQIPLPALVTETEEEEEEQDFVVERRASCDRWGNGGAPPEIAA
jgi:hypothetical protein